MQGWIRSMKYNWGAVHMTSRQSWLVGYEMHLTFQLVQYLIDSI